ncbi:MAG: DUF924 domain-containing protein [Polaromonas sp.]|uniref:DUF924 family protein n=1 Tax=Polaromonas sp. TaxID=1869339 RepID=UPI002486FA21|nr:DUF924 family protein [Polaromonas sp.]MDI1238854.1 DUF924 domain-containing protein [Polaromonas sp.]MDI1340560.1 DUF924 domain-containing protein [Polaromonas sp.]
MPSSSISSPGSASPDLVLDFWFGDGLTLGWPSQDMGKRWFTGGPQLDEDIRQTFGKLVEQALAGRLADWEAQPLSRLALVILLDQFPRNIFRGTEKAFAGDEQAQHLVSEALARRMDEALPWVGRVFLYMPLTHAESLALQEEGVRRFSALVAAVPEAHRASVQSSLDFAVKHRDIIARYGRFPHRNNALGRTSSALEFEFLKIGPRFGQ